MGWYGAKKISWPEALVLLPGGGAVERGKIKEYFDDNFHVAYQEWSRWQKFGLGGSWRDERPIVIQLIELFDSEVEKWREAEIKKSGSRRTKSNR